MPLGYRGIYLTMCNPNLIKSVKIADNSDIGNMDLEIETVEEQLAHMGKKPS